MTKDFIQYVRSTMTESIKINVPETERDYETGNGVGCWALVDADTKRRYDADEERSDDVYLAVLDSDINLYGLRVGDLILIEMRGKNRPVYVRPYTA